METPAASNVYAMIGASDNNGIGSAWLKELESEFDFKMAPGQNLTSTSGNGLNGSVQFRLANRSAGRRRD